MTAIAATWRGHDVPMYFGLKKLRWTRAQPGDVTTSQPMSPKTTTVLTIAMSSDRRSARRRAVDPREDGGRPDRPTSAGPPPPWIMSGASSDAYWSLGAPSLVMYC